MFKITHHIDGRLQAVVLAAKDETEAQEAFIAHYESRNWIHGVIVDTEEV